MQRTVAAVRRLPLMRALNDMARHLALLSCILISLPVWSCCTTKDLEAYSVSFPTMVLKKEPTDYPLNFPLKVIKLRNGDDLNSAKEIVIQNMLEFRSLISEMGQPKETHFAGCYRGVCSFTSTDSTGWYFASLKFQGNRYCGIIRSVTIATME